KALSGLAAEGHVMPDPFNGPAGLGPANHVAVRQVLVFEANGGLGKYPNLSHLSQRASRQGQSLPSLVARFTTSHAHLLRRLISLLRRPYCWLRAAYRCSDHLLGAARPADVLARVLDRDREIVPAAVVAAFGARRASRHVVAPDLAELRADVVQNPEPRPARAPLELRLRLRWRKLSWNRLTGNQ